MVDLKFKRIKPGKYESITDLGVICIEQKKDKWYFSLPGGKSGYRDSYAKAKKWVQKCFNNYNNSSTKTINNDNTLQQKLTKHGSYICGVEPLGCINSGVNACILRIDINHHIYYLVGEKLDITDTIFYKNAATIKYNLKNGAKLDYYTCPNGNMISIFLDNLEGAENLFNCLNETISSNNKESLKEIQSAKERYKKGDIASLFTLNDYGCF